MKTFVPGVLSIALLAAAGGAQTPKPAESAKSPELAKLQDPAIRLIGSIKGPALYKAYCAVCHGEGAKGNGPMSKSLKVEAPDLTRIAARHGGKFPLEQISHIVSGEAPRASGHGTREMPVWGPIFSKVEQDQDWGLVRIDNLVKYLRDIQVK